jgi:hypothetical protein
MTADQEMDLSRRAPGLKDEPGRSGIGRSLAQHVCSLIKVQ